MAESNKPIGIKDTLVFDDLSVTQNTTSASLPAAGIELNLNDYDAGTDGYFALDITVTSGTFTIGYEVASREASFVKPSAAATPNTALTVATTLASTGGPDSDGRFYLPLTDLPVSDFVRFYATEENVAAGVIRMVLVRQ